MTDFLRFLESLPPGLRARARASGRGRVVLEPEIELASGVHEAVAGADRGEQVPPVQPAREPEREVAALSERGLGPPAVDVWGFDPGTLPAGPFLAYDREGNLVSSVYMIPLKDINDHKAFEGLNVAPQSVDHVDMYYNAGHPGVAEPHYHVILWYVTPEKAEALKK